MRLILSYSLIFFSLLLAASSSCVLAKELDTAWRPLLGEDLQGWEVWTGIPHKSVSVPGFPQSTSEDSHSGTPVGLGDPLEIFTVKMVDGEPVLHVTGQVFAGLTSLETFKNYHLSLEYKWGEKKWPPRMNAKRDSGLLLHCNGKHGAFWKVWMQCIECQIQEGDTGDLYLLAGSSANVSIMKGENKGKPQYSLEGEWQTVGNGTPAYGSTREKNREVIGRWNRVDAYVVEDQMAFAVNGHVVMRLKDTKSGRQQHGKTLTEGQIQIQSEAAEIDYRRIRIRGINQLPEGKQISLVD